MTNVCVRCGWLVFERDRCKRCSGPAIGYRAAARGCGVSSLHELLHISPEMRVLNFKRAAGSRRARPATEPVLPA